MRALFAQLRECLESRVCFVGLGSPERADDAVGLRLAEALESNVLPAPSERSPYPQDRLPTADPCHSLAVCSVGVDLERHLHRLAAGAWDHVVFLDAADFGAEPGAVALFDRAEMRARFPQCSTHRLSLGLVADLIESSGSTRVWLLAVQPKNLRSGDALSPEVERALEILTDAILERSAVGRLQPA